MDSSAQVRALLKAHGIRLKKGLGQNFLVEDVYLQRIVEAAGLNQKDEVLEIGAGIGTLTRYLALAVGQVTAVEIDAQLFPLLEEQTRSMTNVKLVKADIMKIPIADLMARPGYKVVANIPYYLTSNLIRRLLESPARPTALTLTLQQEVAERICATAGQMSLLALSVQVYGQPQVALKIPPSAFYPLPQVDSATLVVDLFKQPLIPPEKIGIFFRLIKAAFGQKRKMLHNALAAGLGMESGWVQDVLLQAGIDPQRRAQTVTLDEWRRLVEIFDCNPLQDSR